VVAPPPPAPEVKLVNRVLPPQPPVDEAPKLFEPEGSAEGCASGECLPAPAEPDDEPAAAPVAPETDHDRWSRAVDALRQTSPRHGKSLSFARFLGFTPEGVRVAFAPDAAFHKSQVTGMSRAIVENELTRSLGRAIKLLDESNAQAYQAAPKSIAEVEATDRATRERGIDRKVHDHPAIRTILKHLGGAVEHIAYLEPTAKPRASAPEESAPADE
jgi:hypothetical protein